MSAALLRKLIGERDVYKFELVQYIYISMYVWKYVCHMPRICNVGRVRPQPFFI